MVLVSHSHRFVYTKTYKTGGTSVEGYFERFCMPPGTWSPQEMRDKLVSPSGIVGYRGFNAPVDGWVNHMSAADVRDRLGEDTWSSYFKFAVVRDPFDKALSAFFWQRRRRAAARPPSSNRRDQLRNLSDEFEQWLAPQMTVLVDRAAYTIDGEMCMDHMVRYESLAQDVAEVSGRIGEPFQPALLPRYKSGVRDRSVTPADLYSPRTVALIAEAFAFELDWFGYPVPSLDGRVR